MLTIKVPQSHGPGVAAFEVEQRWDQSGGQRGAFGSVTGDLCLCMSSHPNGSHNAGQSTNSERGAVIFAHRSQHCTPNHP